MRQYRLERKSIDIDVAADRKTARVTADYVETMPYYEPDAMPATPDDFREFQSSRRAMNPSSASKTATSYS